MTNEQLKQGRPQTASEAEAPHERPDNAEAPPASAQEGPSYDELRMQLLGCQAMLPELQDHVTKLSGRAAELSGLLAQERARLNDMRQTVMRQAALLAEHTKKPKVEKDDAVERVERPRREPKAK
jgi:hypothetical protein